MERTDRVRFRRLLIRLYVPIDRGQHSFRIGKRKTERRSSLHVVVGVVYFAMTVRAENNTLVELFHESLCDNGFSILGDAEVFF